MEAWFLPLSKKKSSLPDQFAVSLIISGEQFIPKPSLDALKLSNWKVQNNKQALSSHWEGNLYTLNATNRGKLAYLLTL